MGDFRRLKILFLILLSSFLSSCSPFFSKTPPVILILVDSFSEKDYLCSDTERLSELQNLEMYCDSLIRFTHAYAPTTLSQPNLATLMTGKSVTEHRVHHNGPHAIPAKFQTLAESALNSGLRTAFFSGGVPVLDKFGMSQGFERYSVAQTKSLFLPFRENLENALRWIDSEAKRQSFFLSLYAPDLLYSNRVLVDKYGNERPRNRQSSVQEIYESIDFFIGELKKRKLFDVSTVVVMGVGGAPEPLNPINPLGGHQTHVSLQIKSSTKIKHNFEVLVGELASFEKIGGWLEELVNHVPSQGFLNFSSSKEEFFIAQQSHWRRWMGLLNWSTYGLRRKQYLFLFDPVLRVYDSYVDKKETDYLDSAEVPVLSVKYELSSKMNSFFPGRCYGSNMRFGCENPKANQQLVSDLQTLKRLSDEGRTGETSTGPLSAVVREASQNTDNQNTISWLAYQALSRKNWTSLFELGRLADNDAWLLVANLNLRVSLAKKTQGCLKFFVDPTASLDDFYKSCQDSGLRKVVAGVSRLKNKLRPSQSFWEQVHLVKSQRQAKQVNLNMLFINDVVEAFDFGPSLSELYFYLPENRDYLKLIDID